MRHEAACQYVHASIASYYYQLAEEWTGVCVCVCFLTGFNLGETMELAAGYCCRCGKRVAAVAPASGRGAIK